MMAVYNMYPLLQQHMMATLSSSVNLTYHRSRLTSYKMSNNKLQLNEEISHITAMHKANAELKLN